MDMIWPDGWHRFWAGIGSMKLGPIWFWADSDWPKNIKGPVGSGLPGAPEEFTVTEQVGLKFLGPADFWAESG